MSASKHQDYQIGDYAGIGYHGHTTVNGDKWENRVAQAITDFYRLRTCEPKGKRKIFAEPFDNDGMPDDCVIRQYPYLKLKGGKEYGRADLVCKYNGMTVGIECKHQGTSGTADEKTYYALDNISRQYKQDRRLLLLGGDNWAPEIVADLKMKAAHRVGVELQPNVDVLVATEQEFFDDILPHLFDKMTPEQIAFNEKVAEAAHQYSDVFKNMPI